MSPVPIGAPTRFVDRIEALRKEVGGGHLVGRVVVDQIYAAAQHEHLGWRHPEGGGPKYLEGPLFARRAQYMEMLARGVLDGTLRDQMVAVVEDLSGQVYENAPVEFSDLRASAAPAVLDGGRYYYQRKPNRRRLSRQELRIKNQLRGLGFGNRS